MRTLSLLPFTGSCVKFRSLQRPSSFRCPYAPCLRRLTLAFCIATSQFQTSSNSATTFCGSFCCRSRPLLFARCHLHLIFPLNVACWTPFTIRLSSFLAASASLLSSTFIGWISAGVPSAPVWQQQHATELAINATYRVASASTSMVGSPLVSFLHQCGSNNMPQSSPPLSYAPLRSSSSGAALHSLYPPSSSILRRQQNCLLNTNSAVAAAVHACSDARVHDCSQAVIFASVAVREFASCVLHAF